jgi:FKBP-type peptidyl-prolyl cis-trans isomerase FkpA
MLRSVPLLLPVGFVLALTACDAAPAGVGVQSTSGVPETDDEKILYVLGQILGRDIASAGFSEDEIAFVQLGLSDSALGREAQVELDEYGPMLQGFMDERIEAAGQAELVAAEAFVAEQAALAGATRTPSGIVIQEMTAGSGASPVATDTVRVHYHGTLRDGTVFDSSVDRGEPATFPLNGVIPCWTEGLQSIQVGGKSRLICPPDLAYGPGGRPGIPGNAALVFEVELLEIVE